MIRVLHIDTERTWRGGEAQVFGLASRLPSDEFQSVIACPRKSALLEKSEAIGLPILPLTGISEFSPRMLGHLVYGIRHFSVDLIHVHTSHGLIVADCARRFFRKQIPIVYSRRTDFHLRTRFLNLSRLKYSVCADRILTVSQAIRKVLIQDGLPESRIQTIYSGIDVETFHAGLHRDAVRESLGIGPNVKVVGMVGALVDHKDPMVFLRAATHVCSKMQDVIFILVGAGRLWDTLQTAHTEMALHEKFRMTGFQQDVRGLLDAFDVFCMTSREEGLCTSILDAMAMRLPVVATRAGGIPEAVEDSVTGHLVQIGDHKAVADRIETLLNNPKDAQRMGNAGRERVESLFDINQTARSTAMVYRELLKNPC